MKRILLALSICIGLSVASNADAGKKPIAKPGLWEATITMQMPGMPMPMKPVITTRCLTEKDFVPSSGQPDQDCKVIKQKADGSKIEWTTRCKDKSGNTTEMSGKGVYKSDSFIGTMTLAMTRGGNPAMQMSFKISSKRIGPCKKTKP